MKISWSSLTIWSKRLFAFGAVQVAVQLLTAVMGFLCVRWLTKEEYAFFTIATSLQFLVCHFSDMGVTVGVSAIGGHVWNDAGRFGLLLNTAQKERLRIAMVSSLVVVPYILALLLLQKCGWIYAVLLTLCSLWAALCQMKSGIYSVAPRFHGQLRRLRNLDLGSALLRLGLLAPLLFVLPAAVVPVVATGVVAYMQLTYYQRWSLQLAERTAAVSAEYRKELRRIVLRLMPSGIFFAFQGQISVALIAFFGQAGAVADVGALARLGIIFSVISTTVANVLLPSFSKTQDFHALAVRFWSILSLVTGFAASMTALAFFFPGECLWLLGAKYQGLTREVFLIAISSGLGSIQATIWSMIAARAWVEWAWLDVPIPLLTLMVCLLFIDVRSVHGVLLMGCYSQMTIVLSNSFMAWQGFKKFRQSGLASEPTVA